MRLARLALGFLALINLGQINALAATTHQRTLEQMCQFSDLILQGRVTGKNAAYEANGQIWTTYTLQVSDGLKGKAVAGGEIKIKQIGGTVGDITLHAVGIPHFEIGEELLLFTRDPGAGWQIVVNGPQGVYRIITETTRGPLGEKRESKRIPAAARGLPEAGSTDLESVKTSIRQAVGKMDRRSEAKKS